VVTDDTVILRRGLDTFAELGYDATTVRELARRLAVSHNFINDRYGSKANFWRAVVDFAIRDLLAPTMAAIDPEIDDAVCLANVVRQLHRIAAHNPQVNRIVADESVRDSERLDYLYEQYTGRFWDQVSPIVQRLMDAGRMPRVPVDLVFFAITGPALTLTHHQLARRLGRPATGADQDQDLDQTAEHLACLVLNGLLPDGRASDR
jgi:TetR/AcrR family transcriptional regulator